MRRSACIRIVFLFVFTAAVPRGAAWSAAPGGPLRAQSPSFYWMASAGNYDADDNAGQLDDERGQFGLSGGLGWRLRPAFALDFEIGLYAAEFDAPPVGGLFVTISDVYDLETTVILGTARIELPVGRVRPFAGAGAGLFLTELKRPASFLGVPGFAAREKDAVPGLSLNAGLALVLTPEASITFEYRRMYVSADFGGLTDGDVDVGGALVLAGFRYTFSHR